MKEDRVPGLSLAVIQKGKVTYRESFGYKNWNTKESVTDYSIFEGASLTKPLVAYTTLQLVEQGILKLDEPLFNYLSEDYLPDEPLANKITARHILSHTCGFPNWRGDSQLQVQFTPGEKFSYSGEGFVYLQKVIEEITGQPLEQIIKKYIFDPFGMKDSSLIWMDKYDNLFCNGHDKKLVPEDFYKTPSANAAWSLLTNSREYANFICNILMPNDSISNSLGPEMIQEMLNPEVQLTNNIFWGLGWGIIDNGATKSYWHWGDNDTFKTFVIFSREDQEGIVIMTNGVNGLDTCKKIITYIMDKNCLAYDEYLDPLYSQ